MSKDIIEITKIVGSKSLLSRNQADKVLEYFKTNPNKYIDFRKVAGCTSAFVNHLIYNYNIWVDFDKSRKLVFFNVKNPIVSLKIQEAQFNFFSKKGAKEYVEFHDKLVNDMLENG